MEKQRGKERHEIEIINNHFQLYCTCHVFRNQKHSMHTGRYIYNIEAIIYERETNYAERLKSNWQYQYYATNFKKSLTEETEYARGELKRNKKKFSAKIEKIEKFI